MCDFDMHQWCERLIEQEGMKLMPCYCGSKKWAIGVKRYLEFNPLTTDEKKALGDYKHGITVNGAKMLLRHDILQCYEVLKKKVKFYENLCPDRQYALLDLCFQLGIKGVKKFRGMLTSMEKENFEMAAFECLLSDYAREFPKRAKRIAQAIKSGVWK